MMMGTESVDARNEALTNYTELRRGGIRRDCSIDARIFVNSRAHACSIRNMSPTGAGIETSSIIQIATGTHLRLHCPAFNFVNAVVRWSSHPRYGLEFEAAAQQNRELQLFVEQL
jgi:PilZ domain